MDVIESQIGQWGRFQTVAYAIGGMTPFLSALHMMGFVFTAAVPPSRCRVDEIDSAANHSGVPDGLPSTSTSWTEKDPIARVYDFQKGSSNWCRYCPGLVRNVSYGYDLVPPSSADNSSTSSCRYEDSSPCDQGHTFSQRPFRSTIVSEFGLVCTGQGWKRQMLPSATMLGVLVGTALAGSLSDRFGRRPVILLFSGLGIVAYHVTIVAPSYALICLLQALSTMCSAGAGVCAYCIIMELCGGLPRTIAGIWWQGFFTVAYVYVGVAAYFVRDWRRLQLCIAAPSLLLVPWLFFLPESYRWLISRGRLEPAVRVFQRILRWNEQKEYSQAVIKLDRANVLSRLRKEQGQQEETGDGLLAKEVGSIRHIWRQPKMLRIACIIFYAWFACSLSYFGLSLNIGDLPGDIYVNYVISGLIEIPAYILAVPMMEKIGRKWTLVSTLGFGGVALIGSSLLPQVHSGLVIALALIGKLGVSIGFAVAFNYTIEVFPTPVRNTGLGCASATARIASILAPQVAQLGPYVHRSLPFVIYGSVAASSAALMLLAPETKGRPLPQTMEESVLASTPHSSESDISSSDSTLKSFVSSAAGGGQTDPDE